MDTEATEEHTEEGTGGEDGGDEGLLGGRDGVAGGVVDEVGRGLAKEAKPVLHGGDTRDGTGVVPKEDTAKGGEGDHADADDIAPLRAGTDAWAGCGRTTWHC